MVALDEAAIRQETQLLRRRYDDLTSECSAMKKRLAVVIERSQSFVPTSELDVDKDADAAEVRLAMDERALRSLAVAHKTHAPPPRSPPTPKAAPVTSMRAGLLMHRSPRWRASWRRWSERPRWRTTSTRRIC